MMNDDQCGLRDRSNSHPAPRSHDYAFAPALSIRMDAGGVHYELFEIIDSPCGGAENGSVVPRYSDGNSERS